MLAKLKLYAIGALSLLSAVLLGWLKIRGQQLEVAEDELRHKDAEIEKNKAVYDTTNDIQRSTELKKATLKAQHDNKKQQILEERNDRPLSPSLLKLLRPTDKN